MITSNQFPQLIIKETVNLYQKLCQLLNIKKPDVRAIGINYFYKFYQKSHADTPEYAITAISCFHLATKICEIPMSYKRYINEIKHSPKSGISSTFLSIFQVLDGIPPSNIPNFQEVLLKKLVQKEIQVIISLQFDFSVQLPYDISVTMIDRILKWHIKSDDPILLPLREELASKCFIFFNDLQTSELFYTKSPELIAISTIELVFYLFELPLISPKNSPWFTFLVPDVDINEINQIESEIKKIFYFLFINVKSNTAFKSKLKFDKKIFCEWIRFPLIPLKKYPICDPPDLELLQNLVSGDDSFKKCQFDHVPNFPPPDFQPVSDSEISPNLQQMKNEYSDYIKKL